jgi:predicted permease
MKSPCRKLFDRIDGLPGVRIATTARFSPFSGSVSASNVDVEGYSPRPDESRSVSDVLVGPHYPTTLGIPLLLGREVNLRDTVGSTKVAMVNEAFVRHYFPADNPIGHRFGYAGQSYEIVGVLQNALFEDAKTKVRDMIFRALLQDQTQTAMTAELELRTIGDPGTIASQVREAVSQEDSKIPVSGVQTLRDQVEGSFNEERLAARLVSFFGGLALFLACIGLYGVTAQSVTRRTNEIGVRMALGAGRRDILGMILRETGLLLGASLALGLPLSYAASRAIASQLFGLGPGDISSFLVALAILATVMVLAGFLPALRATRVDPVVALRYE